MLMPSEQTFHLKLGDKPRFSREIDSVGGGGDQPLGYVREGLITEWKGRFSVALWEPGGLSWQSRISSHFIDIFADKKHVFSVSSGSKKRKMVFSCKCSFWFNSSSWNMNDILFARFFVYAAKELLNFLTLI